MYFRVVFFFSSFLICLILCNIFLISEVNRNNWYEEIIENITKFSTYYHFILWCIFTVGPIFAINDILFSGYIIYRKYSSYLFIFIQLIFFIAVAKDDAFQALKIFFCALPLIVFVAIAQ